MWIFAIFLSSLILETQSIVIHLKRNRKNREQKHRSAEVTDRSAKDERDAGRSIDEGGLDASHEPDGDRRRSDANDATIRVSEYTFPDGMAVGRPLLHHHRRHPPPTRNPYFVSRL